MRKTREVLRLYFELKLKQRQIARSANVSQSTVHEYLERFRAAGLNWPLPAEMSETDREGKLFPDNAGVSRPGAKTPPDFAYIHQQLQGHKHTTLQLLWEEYRAGHADGYGYSRFCHHYQRFKQDWSPRAGIGVFRRLPAAGSSR
jgi:transposase